MKNKSFNISQKKNNKNNSILNEIKGNKKIKFKMRTILKRCWGFGVNRIFIVFFGGGGGKQF